MGNVEKLTEVIDVNLDLTPSEIAMRTAIMALDSVDDALALTFPDLEPENAAAVVAPAWVHSCARIVRKTFCAPMDLALANIEWKPYKIGYGFGLIQRSMDDLKELEEKGKATPKGRRLPPKLRRKVGNRVKDLFIKYGLIETSHNGRSRFIRAIPLILERRASKWRGREGADFYQGMADGRHGVGPEAPGDKSTTATPVYFQMVVMWRFVERMDSLKEFHDWLTAGFGQSRAGSLARSKRICRKLGKRFKRRGRPRINRTPVVLR